MIIATALMTGAPAFADDAHHPDKSKPVPAAKQAPRAAKIAKTKDTAAMMDNMKTMQAQMAAL